MATKFEDLVNNMVNIGFGAAALTAEKGKEVLDSLSAKGEEVRSRFPDTRFRAFHVRYLRACGRCVFRCHRPLSYQGESVAERILDELILARVRTMTKAERVEFMVARARPRRFGRRRYRHGGGRIG